MAVQLATQGQASLEVEAPAQEIAAFRIQLPTTQLQPFTRNDLAQLKTSWGTHPPKRATTTALGTTTRPQKVVKERTHLPCWVNIRVFKALWQLLELMLLESATRPFTTSRKATSTHT